MYIGCIVKFNITVYTTFKSKFSFFQTIESWAIEICPPLGLKPLKYKRNATIYLNFTMTTITLK